MPASPDLLQLLRSAQKRRVEQEGSRFQRNQLVPSPRVGSLAEFDERLAGIDAAQDGRHVHGASASVRINLAEAPLLHPTPAADFELGTTLTPLVHPNAGT
jgi:hypothetical protein